jgi:hypothetical protein
MSLMEAVALTYLVSAVIMIGVLPMLLSAAQPPAWLVQADPYVEDRWQEQAWISNGHRLVRSVEERLPTDGRRLVADGDGLASSIVCLGGHRC